MDANLKNHPVALASTLGALLALMGQSAFNKVFEGVYALITERVQFPMTLQKIEYYRHVSNPCSVQLRNTIEDLNARIEYEQEANKQWFLVDWASTDRWNDVKPIMLDCSEPVRYPPGFTYGEPLTLPAVPPVLELKRR